MEPEEFNRVFKLPFTEAEAFFKDKLNIPTGKWDELSGAAHAKGFMSAGAYNADLLADLRKMTDKAIAGGMDIREFRKEFRPLVEKYGWQLKGGGPAWRSDLIFRTNIQTAYQAGRWQQFEASGIDYLMYMHNDSVMHPRPHHVALDGKVFLRTDAFWSRNYPPQGFGCKCRAVAATEKEFNEGDNLRPQGWEDMADKGWDYNVGQEAGRGYEALTEKFEKLPADIGRKWMDANLQGSAFERFCQGKIESPFPVAVLGEEEMAALSSTTKTVWFSPESLKDHLKKHPDITIDDYRKIQEVLEKGEIYQQEGKTERLIYLTMDGKLYRAGVKTTRDKKKNFFLTLFETTEERIKAQQIKEMKRVR